MIYTSDRKSDETDARMLAKLARLDVSLLHPVQHGSERAQRDLLQIKLRDNLVRQRVDVISAVRFTLKSLGVRLQSPKTSCFAKRARKTLEEAVARGDRGAKKKAAVATARKLAVVMLSRWKNQPDYRQFRPIA